MRRRCELGLQTILEISQRIASSHPESRIVDMSPLRPRSWAAHGSRGLEDVQGKFQRYHLLPVIESTSRTVGIVRIETYLEAVNEA